MIQQVLFDGVMSSSEEDSYSMIFTSLKHPIRRKILRILSSEAQTFSDLQKQFKIESSHLTYHIDGLGNLLYKTEDGKYALSSLGEAAVSMMRNVEEPPTTLHFPFTRRRLKASENKVVGRNVALALGIICIVLAATLVGAFAYYVPMINDKDHTISSLGAQISQLHSNITNLQKQIASDNSTINSLTSQVTNLQKEINDLLNATSVNVNEITVNPSAWVNRTVVVEGVLSLVFFPVFEYSPWGYELISGNQTIGVSMSASVNMSALWNHGFNGSGYVRIYGVVEKGEIIFTPGWGSPEVTYYIEAEAVEPL
jgi:DNA-binding transcriptional ArsR family regulator